MILTKVKLNFFVVITTTLGAILYTGFSQMDWLKLVHTIIGTGAAALGAAAFNQLIEIEHDRKMERTADRPLPKKRMSIYFAFTVAWVLSGFGIIHLSSTTNFLSSALTAATIALYIFVYTPLKRKSALNTLVGAIPGAIPPVVGWIAMGGEIFSLGALLLFVILFFWQMPHFLAINWLCRKEYQEAGYVMWAEGDDKGTRTTRLSYFYTAPLVITPLIYGAVNALSWWSAIILSAAAGFILWKISLFSANPERVSARAFFFSTLIYLPIALSIPIFGWQ